MGTAFATIDDVTTLWRPMQNQEEAERCEALLPLISDELRCYAQMVGKDLDAMIEANSYLTSVAKEVTVTVVSRILRANTSGEPMTQESRSGLGYTWSGTYAIPGGGIGSAIMKNDLKRLGLRIQRIGVIDFYDPGNNGQTV